MRKFSFPIHHAKALMNPQKPLFSHLFPLFATLKPMVELPGSFQCFSDIMGINNTVCRKLLLLST